MVNKMRYVMAMAGLLSVAQAWAGGVTVSDVWARATAPGQNSAAVYLKMKSQLSARLVGVTSAAADSAEIHSMTHDNGVMRMRALEALPLPAGQQVELGSGGNHLMLLGLKRPLKVGGKVSLIFIVRFADGHKEKIKAKAEVKSFTAAPDDTHQHHSN